MTVTTPENVQDLLDAFELLGDWEQRYQFIIDMGKKLPPMPPGSKTPENFVHGCQATVYMVARALPTDPPTIEFLAESDAFIVNGLIAILQKVFSGQTPQFILTFPVENFLKKLGLDEHLSPTRRNGLYEMVKRIRTLARHAVHSPSA